MWIALLLVPLTVCVPGFAAEPAFTVEDAVAAALARDPSVAAADARIDAAEATARAARGPQHDPSLEVRLGFGVPQHEATLSQELSLSGEGQARARAARGALSEAELVADAARLDLATAVRLAWVDALAADATALLMRERAREGSAALDAIEARHAAGEVSELDVRLARLDQRARAAEAYELATAAVDARLTLATLTGLPFDAQLELDPRRAVPAEAETAPIERAIAEARADVAEAEVRAERAASFAPVELGLWGQVQNVGVDAHTGSVVIPSWAGNAGWTVGPQLRLALPTFQANRAARAASMADARAADAEVRAVDARIDAATAAAEAALSLAAEGEDRGDHAELASILAAIDRGVRAGELDPVDAAHLRVRALEAWRTVVTLNAARASRQIQAARQLGWRTLLGSGAQ